MPRAELHPEYDLERAYLTHTLTALQAEIARLGQSSATAAYMNARLALHDMMVKRYKALQIATASPYIGRLDLQSLGYRPKAGGAAQEKYSLVEIQYGQDDDLTDDLAAYYIGEADFQDKASGVKIIGWETPLANLFYEAIEGEAAYETQTRLYRLTTHLKRNLIVKQQQLINITDDFDSRPNKPAIVTAKRDQAILESLADRRAGYLDKITGTIDRDQNRLIRADRHQVLLIQGVAGSGKSIIAQYRLAYLYKTSQGQLRAEDCIVFGPNRLFLDYASRVLPSLQVENIQQTTFADWACEQLGLKKYKLEDAALAATLADTAGVEKDRVRRASQLKNSRRMGDLLKRYVAHRQATMALPANGLSFKRDEVGRLTLALSGAEVKTIFESATHELWAEQRARFIAQLHRTLLGQVETAVSKLVNALRKESGDLLERSRETRNLIIPLSNLAEEVEHQYDADLESQHTAKSLTHGAQGLTELADYYQRRSQRRQLEAERLLEEAQDDKRRKQLATNLLKDLTAKVEEFWPPPEVVDDYHSLLGDKDLLRELGRPLFADYELDALHERRRPKGNHVDVSDTAALLQLHILYHGFPAKYKHIILDEAQDISPLQFVAIRHSSQNGSVTLLGDLAQSIYEYRGTANWDEVRETFADFKLHYTEITQSYRNTYEIMSLANAVLATLAKRTRQFTLAKPFDRHDVLPTAKLLETIDALPEEIFKLLKQLQADGHENIAVITKTADECRTLSSALHELEFTEFRVALSGDVEHKGGVMLLPVHLAKGLEFEAVVLAHVSAAHYTDSDFDTRLLYVAATRALHELHVVGVGRWPTQLTQALEAGVIQAR